MSNLGYKTIGFGVQGCNYLKLKFLKGETFRLGTKISSNYKVHTFEVLTYVTGNLCNQALRVMTEHFSPFAKCLNSLAISRNA